MKTHKRFLDLLKNAKAGSVSGFLIELGLIPNDNPIFAFTPRSIDEFESIAYTIDFLEKNNLVTVRMDAGDIPKVRSDGKEAHVLSRSEYLQSLLERHYRKHLITTPEFMLFAERGYRPMKALDSDRKVVILFVRTILLAIVTALVNQLFVR